MRYFLTLTLLVAISSTTLAQDKPAAAPAKLETLTQRASYAIGAQIGGSMKEQGIKVDLKVVLQGMADALAGKELALTEEELNAAFAEFQQQMRAQQLEAAKKAAAENLKVGAAFLAANAKKEGVKTTESGLQYKVIKRGEGATPKATSNVRVHYEGRLISGKVFDSSIKRGTPAEFPVNGVIKGWTEALQLMKEGDEWELYIPSTLAYGTRGAGADIGPNATLIFQVKLIKVLN